MVTERRSLPDKQMKSQTDFPGSQGRSDVTDGTEVHSNTNRGGYLKEKLDPNALGVQTEKSRQRKTVECAAGTESVAVFSSLAPESIYFPSPFPHGNGEMLNR